MKTTNSYLHKDQYKSNNQQILFYTVSDLETLCSMKDLRLPSILV
jgi:hypothetical protein